MNNVRVVLVSRDLALDAVPTTWLDSLLTGPNAVIGAQYNYGPRDIQRLCNAIRDRIADLPTADLA